MAIQKTLHSLAASLDSALSNSTPQVICNIHFWGLVRKKKLSLYKPTKRVDYCENVSFKPERNMADIQRQL